MIQFRCSECSKAIGVDDEFSGKLIRCPACASATRVPELAVDEVVDAVAIDVEEPTVTKQPIPGFSVSEYADLPVNPAVANPNESLDSYAAHKPFGAAQPSQQRGPTMGKSIGGWFAGLALGLFCSLVWGIFSGFTGAWAQAIGWGIGALVGFVAGIIARNPSIKFCTATSLAAVVCILLGRLISALIVMASVNAMGTFGTVLMSDSGLTIGVMERLIEDEALDELEIEYAQEKVDDFFANEMIDFGPDAFETFASEEEIQVDLKVRQIVREMSEEEKETLLEEVRQKHPGWVEEDWHRSAILDSLIQADEIGDQNLKELAIAELKQLDGNYDGSFFQLHPKQEIDERRRKLGQLIGEKYASLGLQKRKEIYRAARKNHLAWNPVEKEYLAMLGQMYRDGEIPEPLRSHASSQIKRQLELSYDESLDDFGDEEAFESQLLAQNELHEVVNEKLLQLDEDQVKELVKQTEERYPAFALQSGDLLNEISAGLDETIASFESDGTFWGSLKTRFKVLDWVWLCLGTISAFAITVALGQSAKESTK